MEWPHISVIESENYSFPDDGKSENLQMITGLYLCQKSIKAPFHTVPGTKLQTNAIITPNFPLNVVIICNTRATYSVHLSPYDEITYTIISTMKVQSVQLF